jgi:hypothetical protein
MSDLVVRPVPSEHERAGIEAGKGRVSLGVSGSWYLKGGLGCDSAGLYLTDADGERHSIPVPPTGGQLVRLTHVHTFQGGSSKTYELFVADEQHHRLAVFPHDGFEEVPGFDAVAQAAGLAFVEPSARDVSGDGGYPSTSETLHLDKARIASSDRRSLGHLFHRGGGSSK